MGNEVQLVGVTLILFFIFCIFPVFSIVLSLISLISYNVNLRTKDSLEHEIKESQHEEINFLSEKAFNYSFGYSRRRYEEEPCLTFKLKSHDYGGGSDPNSYNYDHDDSQFLCDEIFNDDTKKGHSQKDPLKSAIVCKHIEKERTLKNRESTDIFSTRSSPFDFLPYKNPFMFDSNSYPELSRDIQVNYLSCSQPPREIHGLPWNYFRNEYYRLISFVSYPKKDSVSTIRLASKGFAYPGDGRDQEIICYFCTARMEGQEEDVIDTEHQRMRKECPMIQGIKCDNVSMEKNYPKNPKALFAKFLEDRQNNKGDAFALAPQSAVSASDEAQRSSQPSDESAASAIVTNSTDLEEADSVVQNSNSGEIIQSSHVMDPSSRVQDQVDRTDVSSARVAVASSNAPNTHVASDTPSQSNASPNNPNTQQSSPQENAPQQGSTQQGNSQQNSQSNSAPQGNSNSENNENSGETTNYEKLGIITARPKRPEYAVFATRMASFNEWPKQHHMKPNDLATAGYFYTGYSDCARCFYCGGGLRNWEPEDNVWVEHARWFPKCAFLLQEVGIDFINTVKTMSGERDDIKYDEVIKRMQGSNAPSPLTFKDKGIERDPAVQTVVDNGYNRDEVCKLALEVRKSGELLSSEKLFESAKANNLTVTNDDNLGSDSVSIRKGGNALRDKETIDTLRNENNDLRQQTTCKICMDMDVAVVFLPCGHFVSCTECSCALTACPLCRLGIKGIVRAYMG